MRFLSLDRPIAARQIWTLLFAAGAVFVIAAAIAFGVLLARSPQSAAIRVRWTPSATALDRAALERRFQLTDAEFDGGTTWKYRLADISTANIRGLVEHPSVEDTANLNRVRYRPELRQDPVRRSALYAAAAGATATLGAAVIGACLLIVARRRVERAAAEARPAAPRGAAAAAAPRAPVPHRPLRESGWWTVAVFAIALAFLVPLALAMWKTPYPISEAIALLEDAEIAEYQVFDPTVRSWYRPLYHLTWRILWDGPASAGTALPLFTLIEIGAAVGLVLIFIRYLRPRTLLDAAAAAFAVAVLVGSPGYRDNLEIPLLMTLVGMPLALGVWMLLEQPHRLWRAAAIVLLTFVAIGFKEQGLVIVPVVVGAWWMGAPGARRSTTAITVVLTLAYLAVRLSTRGTWNAFEQDVGIGFSTLGADEASARFGAMPWIIYAYNAASTAANVLFSEPTAGQFRFVFGLTHGRLEPWEWNHVLSSAAVTGLIGWWGIGTLRRNAGQPWSAESRLFVATVLAVLASGALGFNYARDRLGGMAVPFYALTAYFAVRAAAERAAAARPGRLAAAVLALVLLGAGWQLRAIGTLEQARVRSAQNHREWIVDLDSRRARFARRAVYMRTLEALAPQGTGPALARPTPYPEWFRRLLGVE